MSGISLTSSKRNNLLSLQQTAKLQDLTQNRLATGLKVNSAIDNPSSYYTAQSLNNRADDLNILLDAMSQGIQTLKAVNESLEAGTKFLEQAKSVANSALETAQPVVAKVSTEAELLSALAEKNPGLIVLTADLTLHNKNIVLGTGQSLVGARYLDKNAAETILTFEMSGVTLNGIEADNNSLISDLTITYATNKKGTANQATESNAIAVMNKSGVRLNNLTIKMDTSADDDYVSSAAVFNNGDNTSTKISGAINIEIKASQAATSDTRGYTHGILNYNGGNLIIDSKLTIHNNGTESHGIYNQFGSELTIGGNTEYDFFSAGDIGMGIYNYTNSTTTITDSALLNIHTTKSNGFAICNYDNSATEVKGQAQINITTEGSSAYGISGGDGSNGSSRFEMGGNSRLNIKTIGNNAELFTNTNLIFRDQAVVNAGAFGENGDGINSCTTLLTDRAQLNLKITGYSADAVAYKTFNIDGSASLNVEGPRGFYGDPARPVQINILSAAAKINMNTNTAFSHTNALLIAVAGAQINLQSGAFVSNSAIAVPVSIANGNTLPAEFINTGAAVFEAQPDLDLEMQKTPPPLPKKKDKTSVDTEQYNQILSQYDKLINDSWYKGVNLLKEQDLKVVFNESRSANLEITGVDATAKGLGLVTPDWNDAVNVQQSLNQIDAAINQLRLFASEFGNYYQIVTTRENFTNSLINVLTEGADALTLADMNQESANMLALQTRQQLAVNSLSLASQASQSVLKLF